MCIGYLLNFAVQALQTFAASFCVSAISHAEPHVNVLLQRVFAGFLLSITVVSIVSCVTVFVMCR